MDEFGTVIPLQAPSGIASLEQKLDPFFKTVLMWRIWLKQALKDQGQATKASALMQRLVRNSDKQTEAVPNEKKRTLRTKLDQWFKKWYIDNKLFELQWQDIKNRAKEGGWLKKLLGFMAVLAILGPKTVLNIVKMIGGYFIMFIKMFAGFLPVMIDAFIEFMIGIVPVLGQLLLELVKTFAGIFMKYAKDFWNNLKTGNLGGALKSLAAIFLFAVSMVFVFKRLFGFMQPLLPIFKLLGSALLKFASIMWNVLLPVMKVAITFLMGALKALFAFLMANPIVLIVVGIIAAIALMWKYAEKISAFFDKIISWFKKLGAPMKFLAGALALLFWPVTATVAGIYALIKAFKRIKEVGFKKFMQEVWDKIKQAMKVIFSWDNIKSMFTAMVSKVVDGVSFLMSAAGDGIKGVAVGIWNAVKGIFDSIKSLFGAFWVWARNRGEVSFSEAQAMQKLQMATGSSNDVQKLIEQVKSGEALSESDRAIVEAVAAKEGVSVEQLAKMDVSKYADSIVAIQEAIESSSASMSDFLKKLGAKTDASKTAYRKVFDRVSATRGGK